MDLWGVYLLQLASFGKRGALWRFTRAATLFHTFRFSELADGTRSAPPAAKRVIRCSSRAVASAPVKPAHAGAADVKLRTAARNQVKSVRSCGSHFAPLRPRRRDVGRLCAFRDSARARCRRGPRARLARCVRSGQRAHERRAIPRVSALLRPLFNSRD